jgi:hypothetical protein
MDRSFQHSSQYEDYGQKEQVMGCVCSSFGAALLSMHGINFEMTGLGGKKTLCPREMGPRKAGRTVG